MAGCGVLSDDDEDDEDDTVKIGVSIPEDGGLGDEGEQLLDGYRIAADHINSGSGAFTDGPWATDIDEGILGREIELDIQNTDSDSDGARQSAQTLANEGANMITGGASAEEALSIQEVANEEEIIYLGGLTSANDLSGIHCSQYAFHEMYNPRMAAEALAPVLEDELGDDQNFAQLYPSNDIGTERSLAFRSRFADIGWSHVDRESTREGTDDFSSAVESILGTGADVIVLNYTGLSGASAVRELANQADDDVEVIIPFMNRELLSGAGSALADVIGTVPWTPGLDDSLGEALIDAWTDFATDTDVLSEHAHIAYVQLCQYAAAAERAGELDTDVIIDELEGYEYDLGLGTQELRDCDHQAMRNVPVVRGLPTSPAEANGDEDDWDWDTQTPDDGVYVRPIEISEEATYSCEEEPAASCDF